MIDVPRVVRNKALARGAEAWLGALPELVAALEDEWSISVGSSYADATEAFVAEATLADGTPAVLKLLVGSAAAAWREIAVLRLVDGDGCVRLLRADEARGALLVERLAGLTGLDADAIWEWGAIERVLTGLLCTSVQLQPVGREMLAVAGRIADQPARGA